MSGYQVGRPTPLLFSPQTSDKPYLCQQLLGTVLLAMITLHFIHPDLDEETEEIVADVLGVEVFRQVCCVLSFFFMITF